MAARCWSECLAPAMPARRATAASRGHHPIIRFWQILLRKLLLRKSKIERLQKSRKVFTAAMLAKGDTKVRGRFCERRCGPSRRGERSASSVLKNFVHLPEKTFSTVSALSRRRCCAECPLCADSLEKVLDGPQWTSFRWELIYPTVTDDAETQLG